MEAVWNPLAIPGLLAMALCLGSAAFLLRLGWGRPVNRRLSFVLVLEGVLIGLQAGVFNFFQDESHAPWVGIVSSVAFVALPFAYLRFLACLETRLVAPFRGRAAGVAMLVLALAIMGIILLFPQAPATEVIVALTFLAILVAPLFGLVAAAAGVLGAAPGTAARTQAKVFATAFGVRDALWGIFLLTPLVVSTFSAMPAAVENLWSSWVPPIIVFVYVPLLAYGILKFRLFDIDVKIKWTVSKGLVAAVFFVVYFVVSESATAFFSDTVGTYTGIIAAGILLLALHPLQRLAERITSAAMPGVQASSEYLTFRKFQVYRAALESAVGDGAVTQKERNMLARLREELGILPEDAAALEDDVRAQLAGRAPVPVAAVP